MSLLVRSYGAIANRCLQPSIMLLAYLSKYLLSLGDPSHFVLAWQKTPTAQWMLEPTSLTPVCSGPSSSCLHHHLLCFWKPPLRLWDIKDNTALCHLNTPKLAPQYTVSYFISYIPCRYMCLNFQTWFIWFYIPYTVRCNLILPNHCTTHGHVHLAGTSGQPAQLVVMNLCPLFRPMLHI